VIFVVMLVDGWSQTVTSPTRTQCKQWDDAFLTVFHNALWIVPLLTIFLSLGFGFFLGRFYWWAANPWWRILWVTLFFFSSVLWGDCWVVDVGAEPLVVQLVV
jgi:hypothetical protein